MHDIFQYTFIQNHYHAINAEYIDIHINTQ